MKQIRKLVSFRNGSVHFSASKAAYGLIFRRLREESIMKISIPCTIILTSLYTHTALADYPYVRLNYGRAFTNASVTDTTDTITATATLDVASGSALGFAIGTDLPLGPKWGQFSWEGEFTYRSSGVNGATISGAVPGGFIDGADLDSIKTYSLLGNVWWRPALFGQIRPYAGGGAGAAYLPAGGLSGDDIYALAYQFGGGVDYEFENGIRAGIGLRHFKISANDRDTSDPIFEFDTRAEVSETSVLASASIPFAVFNGRNGRTPSAASLSTPSSANESIHKAQKEAEKLRIAAEKKARKQAARDAKKLEKAEKKKYKKQAKSNAPSSKERSSFFAKLNPFSKKAKTRVQPVQLQTASRPSLSIPKRAVPAPSVKPEANTVSATTLASAPGKPNLRVTPPTNASATSTQALSTTAPTAQLRTGVHFAQLGTYASEQQAKNMWLAKSARQPELLANSMHSIKIVNAPNGSEKFYQLRVGPFDNKSAKAVCALVTGDCTVTSE